MKFDELSNQIIGLALEVHRELGPGLLESAYKQCLCHELSNAHLNFILERQFPVIYKGMEIDSKYRIDLIIEDKLALELKSIETILPIHEAQILTYMKLAKINLGLLINFNVKLLKDGIKRFVI